MQRDPLRVSLYARCCPTPFEHAETYRRCLCMLDSCGNANGGRQVDDNMTTTTAAPAAHANANEDDDHSCTCNQDVNTICRCQRREGGRNGASTIFFFTNYTNLRPTDWKYEDELSLLLVSESLVFDATGRLTSPLRQIFFFDASSLR